MITLFYLGLAFWAGLLYRLWRGPRARVPPPDFVSGAWLAQYRNRGDGWR